MKKVFLTLAVIATVALVSCTGKAKEEATDAPADSAILVEDEEIAIVDTLTADTTAAAPAADTTAVAQ